MRHVGIEALGEIYGPDLFPSALAQADQSAVGGNRVKPVAIERGSASRTVASLLVVRFAGYRFPNFLSVLSVDGKHELLIATLAWREQNAVRDGERGIALPQTLRLPDQGRTAGRPRFQQACFRRHAVALDATPLRPLRRDQRKEQGSR